MMDAGRVESVALLVPFTAYDVKDVVRIDQRNIKGLLGLVIDGRIVMITTLFRIFQNVAEVRSYGSSKSSLKPVQEVMEVVLLGSSSFIGLKVSSIRVLPEVIDLNVVPSHILSLGKVEPLEDVVLVL